MRPILLLFFLSAAQAATSDECAACHREIYDRYRHTPMAVTSGVPAREDLARATFTHAATGFRYRVYRERAGLAFEFTKDPVHGSRELPWFIGSGATARSYLVADDGYLFEAPVAYYSAARKWDLAPAYDRYAYPFLTRPVLPACLACHASALNPVAGTHNQYGAPPFAEPGISCERCHGPGDRHIASAKAADIVNPARLPADRRDSVCAQCHLSGEVRAMHPGATWSTYHPGDRLSDSIAVFVRAGATPGITVTSHVEKLAQSACKQSAGDKLWCGSCHDPHGQRKSDREMCLGCHGVTAAACAAKQHDDCTRCHMPKSSATDAQHVVYTDHSIPRRPRKPAVVAQGSDLVAFPGFSDSPRDLALAWAIVAARPERTTDRPRALALLQQAGRDHPDDAEILVYLAEIYRNTGKPDEAIPLYERALHLDPTQLTATVGLGGIMMERRQFAGAIRLWEDALAKDAGLVLVRTNLAMAYWQIGDMANAERHLVKAVAMAPGFAAPAGLLAKLRR